VRQITDRGEDQTTERCDESAETDHDPVNPPVYCLEPYLKTELKLAQVGSDEVQVLLGGDVVVNRIEPPGYVSDGHAVLSPGVGGDMLRGVTADAPLLEGLREGEPIRHWVRGNAAQFG